MSKNSPLPLFDSMEYIGQQSLAPVENAPLFIQADFEKGRRFLESYNGSQATFNAYRREVERFLHWSWVCVKKSIKALRREDIVAYIAFCQSPPSHWIGIKKAPRFIVQNALRIPNPEWRPFVATVSKLAHRKGQTPDIRNYALSQVALKEIFAILGSFYNFLIQEEYTEANPVAHVRQKSKYLRKQQSKARIRRLSELQWQYVIETAEKMAAGNPAQHERTLFMMTALYAMYLRISELASSTRWSPKMSDFFRDHDGLWWFTTVGKGNKERQISVSDAMLQALKRYRVFLHLTPLPSAADTSSLFIKIKGKGPITSTTYIRKIVQACFDKAIAQLQEDGFQEEAENLMEATVHWLRHTGISEDVKTRPREHVRDDAGHSSSAITDRYIDIALRERHQSARHKRVKQEVDG
jgi:site-specific recombinase XerD